MSDPSIDGEVTGSQFELSHNDAVQIIDGVCALSEELVALRRKIHANPELGWREFDTTSLIAEELRGLGFEVLAGGDFLRDVPRSLLSDDPVANEGETGCIGFVEGRGDGPTVCLRVDIDALPVQEATQDHRPAAEGWASRNPGVMHACGHDGHAAIGLGIAKTIARLRDRLNGKFAIIFQPAEEGGRGARAIVDAGWMKGVDIFLAVHIGLGLPTGEVAIDPSDFLATRKFRATISGKAAHAGKRPEAGRHALLAACHGTLALHALGQSSDPNCRVNVGLMSAGKALNIVPETAEMGFEIRASDMSRLVALEDRCRQALDHAAGLFGATAEIELKGEAAEWRNDPGLSRIARDANDSNRIFERSVCDFSFGASEDATLLAHAVTEDGGKAAIFVLGSDLADGHHTPRFDFDEAVLVNGVSLISLIICNFMLGNN